MTNEGVGSNSCVELFCEAGGPAPPKGHLIHNEENGILSIRYIGEIKAVCDDRYIKSLFKFLDFQYKMQR